MERRKFIKNTALVTGSLFLTNSFANKIVELPFEGINYPGLNEFLKDEANSLKNNSDLERHHHIQFEALKKIPSQTKRVSSSLENFNRIKDSRRNGLENTTVNFNIKQAMYKREKLSVTPTYQHKPNFVNLEDFTNKASYCDVSKKTLTTIQSLFVFAMDNRGTEPFEVDYELAHLLLNPNYYCLGLPMDFPQTVIVTQQLKKEIFLKTGLQTTRSSYNFQSFSYRATSICENGLKDGPQNNNVYYNHDEAISKFHGLVHIDACGDPKELNCKNYKI